MRKCDGANDCRGPRQSQLRAPAIVISVFVMFSGNGMWGSAEFRGSMNLDVGYGKLVRFFWARLSFGMSLCVRSFLGIASQFAL